MRATAVLEHVRRCWASLFTERAVTYRLRNGYDQQQIRIAVIVQQMVHADASGVLFTADPVSGNRRVASIEASFGLGEAPVSGLVTPDRSRRRRRLGTTRPKPSTSGTGASYQSTSRTSSFSPLVPATTTEPPTTPL